MWDLGRLKCALDTLYTYAKAVLSGNLGSGKHVRVAPKRPYITSEDPMTLVHGQKSIPQAARAGTGRPVSLQRAPSFSSEASLRAGRCRAGMSSVPCHAQEHDASAQISSCFQQNVLHEEDPYCSCRSRKRQVRRPARAHCKATAASKAGSSPASAGPG